MLDQRRRRWAAVVQMLHKCFVFAGHCIISAEFMYHTRRMWAPCYDTYLWSGLDKHYYDHPINTITLLIYWPTFSST